MNQPERLLQRLDAIGRALSRRPTAVALIGLGSVGRELDRLDDYSDLDFFAIVESHAKQEYLDDLAWLADAHPLAFAFRNSDDGHKFLYADGIYGEMAVFTPEQLTAATYSPGRIVWRRDDVPDSWAAPAAWPPRRRPVDPDWALGEALTNLYVGLGRFRRGEKLSAFRFIQQFAVDRVLDLMALESGDAGNGDPLDRPRRFERNHAGLAAELPAFMQGYGRSPQSAAAILAYLDARYEINPTLKEAITALL